MLHAQLAILATALFSLAVGQVFDSCPSYQIISTNNGLHRPYFPSRGDCTGSCFGRCSGITLRTPDGFCLVYEPVDNISFGPQLQSYDSSVLLPRAGETPSPLIAEFALQNCFRCTDVTCECLAPSRVLNDGACIARSTANSNGCPIKGQTATTLNGMTTCTCAGYVDSYDGRCITCPADAPLVNGACACPYAGYIYVPEVSACVYDGPPPTGVKGETGAPGTPGNSGLPGAKGNTGTSGIPGPPGTPGAKGDAGTPGAPGTPGTLGAKGDAGTRGATGAQGDKGVKGDTGAKGATGPAGPRGPAGSSAHKVPKKHGKSKFSSKHAQQIHRAAEEAKRKQRRLAWKH